ncbi:MAG: hypothetical protein WKF84_06080 [Pyrinomonadaceae bacterium]
MKRKPPVILAHGRGATAESILTLAEEFNEPKFHYLAPQAAGNSWYPNSFLAPMESNEPGLSSGLRAIGDALAQLEREGIPAMRTMLLGFFGRALASRSNTPFVTHSAAAESSP